MSFEASKNVTQTASTWEQYLTCFEQKFNRLDYFTAGMEVLEVTL